MWQELQWANKQTVGRETEGTQAKLESRSLGNIQTSTAFGKKGRFWTEKNSVYMKYKEATYIACLPNPISPSSVEISPI